MRMVKVVRFYLSGFYKKPKGLKKPYNPILGETFRCCWEHPDGSTTFYVAEQVGTVKSKYIFSDLRIRMIHGFEIPMIHNDPSHYQPISPFNCITDSQVSHHPPISSLFVSNRKAGFDVSATILAKSKYYGNSVSAMMLGKIRYLLYPGIFAYPGHPGYPRVLGKPT